MMETIDYNVSKINLYEQIANTLEQAIIHSDNKTEKLPSEQELSSQFKVSRTVIREALKVLKERGLIDSRNGDGSYVSRPSTDNFSSVLNRIIAIDNISNDDLHCMRLILETAAAKLAAINIKKTDVDHLESILEKMLDTSLSLEQRVRFDADFHITIARSSGNVLLGVFLECMTILLKEYMFKGISGVSGMKKTIVQHRKVLQAIKARDPLAAEEAIGEHLTASRKHVGNYEAKQSGQAKSSISATTGRKKKPDSVRKTAVTLKRDKKHFLSGQGN